MSVEQEIEAASRRFYEALNQLCAGNSAPMSEVWHHDVPVSSAHPMGEWVQGWEPLWASWQELALTITSGQVLPRQLSIFVVGDLAYTVGIEDCTIVIGEQEVRWTANVTNLFRRHQGTWKIVHHHSDKSPAAEQSIDALAG
jgi:ketosteroid isomerase-like protein